jgi:predicted nucleic acid-binding protein
MKLVIDASVTLKWLLRDDDNEQDMVAALAILDGVVDGRFSMIQPPHWITEVLAVMARRRPEAAKLTLQTLMDLVGQRTIQATVYLRAAELSSRLQQHLFDSLYHALAMETGATLITADERYFGAARLEGSIQRLSEFRG